MAGWLVICIPLVWACDGDAEQEAPRAAGRPDPGPAEVQLDASADAGARDAEPQDASDEQLAEVPPAPVSLGLIPVPSAGADGLVDPIERTLAHLETIGSGSRGVSIIRRWDELYAAPEDPRLESWQQLETAAGLYADAGRTVLLSLAVVDRQTDARPPGMTASWSALTVRAAAEQLIDRAMVTFGEELGYLSIGREVDRWLDRAEATEQAQFVEFVKELIAYTRAHAQLASTTRIGVSASWRGLLTPSRSLAELLQASDVSIATYFPLQPDHAPREPAAAPGDLQALLDAVLTDAGLPEVVLQEVGYPSAEGAASSEQSQQRFFQSFFQALEARREYLPFVSVYALNDAQVDTCYADAEALGAAGDEAAVAAWCSMGVRDRDARPKPAWQTLSEALAEFSSP